MFECPARPKANIFAFLATVAGSKIGMFEVVDSMGEIVVNPTSFYTPALSRDTDMLCCGITHMPPSHKNAIIPVRSTPTFKRTTLIATKQRNS